MIIIAGLGNPEKEYKGTRHNAGFEVINKLAYDYDIQMNKVKFRAIYGTGSIKGKSVLLLKPQTYMNLSGESVRDALSFYKLGAENLIVVYDDCALDVGEIRVRKQGSAGGHNGMKSIIYQLETDTFTRVRVGIGEKPPKFDLVDYVLSRFNKNETEKIIEGYTKAGEAVEIILSGSADIAMNKFNKKNPPKSEGSLNTIPPKNEGNLNSNASNTPKNECGLNANASTPPKNEGNLNASASTPPKSE
jgi:PTH1 family peptidyl-tRNA hydrolase